MAEEGLIPIKNVLISVWNKEGLNDLVESLKPHNPIYYSTAGTAQYLKDHCHVAVRDTEKLTEFSELMEGRVKTLHPKVFGGILARRDKKSDLKSIEEYQIPLFDLVVVNLYPFWEHLQKQPHEQTDYIDIGGSALIRAAAKNYSSVTVLSDPSDYSTLHEELSRFNGKTSLQFRYERAARAFLRTAQYDFLIGSQWKKENALPQQLVLEPQVSLRYGENPHQKAAWAGSCSWKQIQGKELSYNNLLDAEAAIRLVGDFETSCVAIVKHNNPCGIAAGRSFSTTQLFERALKTDEQSAFGGIVAFNQTVDFSTAVALSKIFLEVIIAKAFSQEAMDILAQKKNLRLIEWAHPFSIPFEIRPALGGWLVQDVDLKSIPDKLVTVTQKQPSDSELEDLKFAWLMCKHVRSNAIVIAEEGQTLGMGCGQTSRVASVEIAINRAKKFERANCVLASDGFFPFRDNIDILKGKGITAIIQPGGSQRDAEVIQACNELDIAMVFTGERHFKH